MNDEPTAQAGKQILIVDDDFDIRESLADVLQVRGFSTLIASNGREAIELLRGLAKLPSVILLDLMMPVMNGYEFLEERAKDPRLAAIPLAILTAGPVVQRDRIGNGTLVIPKPIDVPKLVGVLHDLQARAASPE